MAYWRARIRNITADDAQLLSTIIPEPDRWHIPSPAEAAPSRLRDGDGDDLLRIAALDANRMHGSLAFLAGYAPLLT